jgi:hypothetical protein
MERHRDLLAVKRATEGRDHVGAGNPVLRVYGVVEAGQVASMLYQNMLKTASRTDERHSSLSGRADHFVGALGVGVGAARTDDHPVAQVGEEVVIDLVGTDFTNVWVNASVNGRMGQGVDRGNAVGVALGKVNQHMHTNHGAIVDEPFRTAN